MTEPSFDKIFDELVEGNERQQLFLQTLADLIPGAGFELHLENGSILSMGAALALETAAVKELLQQAMEVPGLVSAALGGRVWVHGVDLEELDGILLCMLPSPVDLSKDAVAGRLLLNSIRLALMEQDHEELAAEKEQYIRQINILKQQHGKLIEDNYRQYRLNQEKDKEYAKKLESEIARQTAELREANARLEEISRLKSDFLANMSHELRTPMNAIIGFTELLAESRLDTEQDEYAQTIRQSAISLLSLINDILDLAKIEAGKLELEIAPFDPGDVMKNVAAMFKIPAKEKGVEFAYDLDARLPALVLGDRNRLRQILVNLAGNAMKFTEQGRIDIMAACLRALDHGMEIRFSVSDTGIGIPSARKKAIFEKFTQADGSTTRKYGGTGLGLAICQQLVELMGGTIGVESEEGKGSAFSFTVPFTIQAEAALGDEAAAAGLAKTALRDEAPLGHGRILLVEDNAVNQRLASIIIGRQGYELGLAVDGVEALEQIKKQEFDVVLMDLQMPNMDGLTATRKIREIEATPGRRREYASLRARELPLKIIGLTAHARKEDEAACYEAGMDGFLTKPIVKDKLVAALRAVINDPVPRQ